MLFAFHYRRRWGKDPRARRASHGDPQDLRLLRKLRCSTTRITDLVKAVLTLELTAPA